MPKATTMIDEDVVRTQAYLMWEADGRPDGRADHYWDLAYARAGTPAPPKRAAASAKSSVPEKKAKAAKPAPVARAAAKPTKKKPKA